MLFEANHALDKVADYTKLPDGTWAVEVRALRLRVTGTTPTDCKFLLYKEFDERLAKWIQSIHGRSAEQRREPVADAKQKVGVGPSPGRQIGI